MSIKTVAKLSTQALYGVPNTVYEQGLLKAMPQYRQFTAKGTASLFKSNGFLDTILTDLSKLNEVYNCLNRIALNIINVAQVGDPFGIGDFGESFTSEYAAGVQRMAIFPMKPTSPRFRNMPASGVNMQDVRIPHVEDRYFTVNFDFQNFYTIQEFQIKQMFLSEYGVSEFYAGMMAQMQNSYTEQRYLNALECINAGINDKKHPLQETQKITLTSFSDTPTSDELADFVLQVKYIVSHMRATTSTKAYNQLGFKTRQDVSRLRLLCRVGLKDQIETILMRNTYHDEKVNLPFEIIEVENFGGMEPYKDDSFTTPVYEVYDENTGEQVGWAETENATVATLEDADIYWKDPNEKVLALLVDKGIVFHVQLNGPRMIPAPYNAAGLYMTNWFSVPGNMIKWDALYTCVEFLTP